MKKILLLFMLFVGDSLNAGKVEELSKSCTKEGNLKNCFILAKEYNLKFNKGHKAISLVYSEY